MFSYTLDIHFQDQFFCACWVLSIFPPKSGQRVIAEIMSAEIRTPVIYIRITLLQVLKAIFSPLTSISAAISDEIG